MKWYHLPHPGMENCIVVVFLAVWDIILTEEAMIQYDLKNDPIET